MHVSTLFGETLRETPAEVEIRSHQLLLRAGYVRQLAAGIFSYLPLAQRSLKKISTILREEMDAIGGQELAMPVVHPSEPWERSGRWAAIDETMARFKDRRGRDMLLALTHEEIVAELCASEIKSYRQLPQLVYQLQTKFRDEQRARGGLIRVREFTMKDSYSLDRDEDGMRAQYAAHYDAYFRMFARAGLPVISVGSDVGMMGGKVAHEFMYVTPIGEDVLLLCKQCGYSANREVATFRKDATADEPEQLETVDTPGMQSAEEVAKFLGGEARNVAKMVFYTGTYEGGETKLVVGVVRGDHEANLIQLQNLARANALRPAHPEEIRAAGAVPGYASPRGLDRSKVVIVADDLIPGKNYIAGANEEGRHLRNARLGRDYEVDVVGNIAATYEGAPCTNCGAPLSVARGVEVGNIFQLGTRYTKDYALFVDEDGSKKPIVMGSYGIGVGRLLACVAEEYQDEKGLKLPVTVAPFDVTLVSLARDEKTAAIAKDIYRALLAAGIEVLFDDRTDVGVGARLADADLRGMPLRLIVSERSLKTGGLELSRRADPSKSEIVPVADAAAVVRRQLDDMRGEIEAKLASLPRWKDRA